MPHQIASEIVCQDWFLQSGQRHREIPFVGIPQAQELDMSQTVWQLHSLFLVDCR